MRDYTVYMWIGGWLLVLPFLGFPGDWKDSLFVLTALFIIAHSLVGYRRMYKARAGYSETEARSEAESTNETHTELPL